MLLNSPGLNNYHNKLLIEINLLITYLIKENNTLKLFMILSDVLN